MTAMTIAECPQCTKELGSDDPFCPNCRLPALLVGDRYRITQRIASGGFGIVYKAIDATSDEICAIKVIKSDDHDPDSDMAILLRKRFFREAKVTAKLAKASEHIIDIFDYNEDPHYGLFYAMEILQGDNLHTILQRKGSLPISLTLHIFRQLCAAIHTAHLHDIIHRDLKPENIFIIRRHNEHSFVKVLDFGIAKSISGSFETKLTQGILGTPHYLAPEQCTGESEITGTADIYTMGIILFELLTGQTPFSGNSTLALITAHMMHQPPTMSALRPELNIPASLDAAVARALEKAPEARFATAKEFWEAIEPLAHAYGAPRAALSFNDLPSADRAMSQTKDHRAPGVLSEKPVAERDSIGAFEETFDAASISAEERDQLLGVTGSLAPQRGPAIDAGEARAAAAALRQQESIAAPASSPSTQTAQEDDARPSWEGRESNATSEPSKQARMRWIGLLSGAVASALLGLLGYWLWGTPSASDQHKLVVTKPSPRAGGDIARPRLPVVVPDTSTRPVTPAPRKPDSSPIVPPERRQQAAMRRPRQSPKRRRISRRSRRKATRKYKRIAPRPVPPPKKAGLCGANGGNWRWVIGRFVRPTERDTVTSVHFVGCSSCRHRKVRGKHCLRVPKARSVYLRVKAKGFQACRHRIGPQRATIAWRLKLTNPDDIADENYPCTR